jgi:hypothetical protein
MAKEYITKQKIHDRHLSVRTCNAYHLSASTAEIAHWGVLIRKTMVQEAL